MKACLIVFSRNLLRLSNLPESNEPVNSSVNSGPQCATEKMETFGWRWPYIRSVSPELSPFYHNHQPVRPRIECFFGLLGFNFLLGFFVLFDISLRSFLCLSWEKL